ncbi:uncharacterized protein [Pyxicephalus adspersus]|uniref:uncharacterized protein n=1 Tax=Pyxicephalus adspersus TaxID=30357 RepID=UPI003B597101
MERTLLLENLPQVTFDDAAIYFSEEQWQNLEDFQKKIYKELIKEIYETMLALGYRIPKPEIVSRIERGEEPCVDSNKKSKQEGSQAEGSKDAEPVVKVERESPEASVHFPPSEISSSQERIGAQCPRCGTCCNNQCGMGYQWNTQGMYTGPPVDGNHRKPFVPPSPTYFNGSPISPGYTNRGDGMPHPTSPMGYGNIGMVPLSPHYPVFRNVGDPHTTFPFPERPPNPMFGNFEMNQPAPMGPPGSHLADHENRNRKEPYHHAREGPFQERRNPMGPCPACGTFCNNQCGANFQWEQRRLHHGVPGPMETNRYASPPNPYFGAGANPAAFANVRHPLRHGTPPVNVQGNPAMIQLSPQFAGYRRTGDPKSPNILHGKPELPPGQTGHGGSTAAASLHGPNQGGKYGTIPANIGGNHRKSQSMSPLAAIETMPMLATHNPNTVTEQRSRPTNHVANNSPNSLSRHPNQMTNNSQNTISEQRNRPPAQVVTSSDGTRGALQNISKRPDNMQCNSTGGRFIKQVQSVTSPAANIGQPKPSEVTFNKSPSLAPSSTHSPRNAQPSSTHNQEPARVTPVESVGSKRPYPHQASDSGLPSKRASPTVIIVDCDEGNARSSAASSANNQATGSATPPSSKSESLPSDPIVISDSQDSALSEERDGKRSQAPISISRIRTSGIFTPPLVRGKKERKDDSNPIIIIDDKDSEVTPPQQSPQTETSKDETQSSTSGTPPIKNPKAAGEPPPLAPKVQPQGVQQGTPVLVNKVQMQQPSPIIVTGGTNQPLPVNGNQSIMLTFPVTVGSSGIVLATPVNIENQISGVNPANRMPVGKTPRLVHPNGIPISVKPGNANNKIGQVTMRPVIGQTNRLTVPLPHGQAKPIAVSVNQPGNVAGTLSINNTNLQKVNGGTLKAVPVTATGNQAVGQPIPLFVDANSGLILTGPAVPSKDAVPSGLGNATMVTVNGGVVAGNVGPVAVGGKLAFSPVNVNGLANTTFITVDGPVGIGNNSSVTLASNPTNLNNKSALNISNPTILTLNGGLGIGGAHPVGAPIANIASINTNNNLQVAPMAAPAVVSGQQNSGIIIRKVGEPSTVSQNPPRSEDPPVVVVERLFNCSECGEKFNSLENLTSHQAVHKKPDGKASGATSKDNEALPRGADDDAPTILYTTQGDDGSTVYVVTV